MKKGLILLIFILFNFYVIGQNSIDLKNVIPPSPNVSSLIKFTDWPVDLYTGTVPVNIPLYTINLNDYKIDLSLSYHTSGIRVDEISSDIGLGWNLNAGGCISRSVRGIADEWTSGFFEFRNNFPNRDDLLDWSGSFTEQYSDLMRQVENGAMDTEHDLFSFNALGISFKFFFDGQGKIYTQPYKGINLTADFASKTFTATLENGTKLIFGENNAHERTTSTINNVIGGANSFLTAWYLTKVIYPNNNEAIFEYSNLNIKNNINFNEKDYLLHKGIELNKTNACWRTCGPPNCLGSGWVSINTSLFQHEINTSTVDISSKRLSLIKTKYEKIIFNYNNTLREDVEGGYSLIGFDVVSYNNSIIKSIIFMQSYSTSSVSNSATIYNPNTFYHQKRLKLDEVKFIDIYDNTKSISWKLIYNSNKLPQRGSFATDFWGFYNGKVNNSTLLPKALGFLPPQNKIGADREVEPDLCQAEMLTDLINPTGGISHFEYEPNKVIENVNSNSFADKTINLKYDLSYNSGDNAPYKEIQFDITKDQNIVTNIFGYFSPEYKLKHGPTGLLPIYSSLKLTYLTGPFSIVSSSFSMNIELRNSGSYSKYIMLKPGKYSLKLYALYGSTPDEEAGSRVSASLTYQEEENNFISNIEKNVGGLRIKSISYNDKTKPSSSFFKSYEYYEPSIISPFDPYKDYITDEKFDFSSDCRGYNSGCYQEIFVRRSSSNYVVGTINGGIVGYGKVIEKTVTNNNNGYSIYYYTNYKDLNIIAAKTIPFPPTLSRESRRGHLIKKSVFNSQNNLVAQSENIYNFSTKKIINCLKLGSFFHPSRKDCWVVGGLFPEYLIARDYEMLSEFPELTSNVETIYTQSNQKITTTTNYFYDNQDNIQPTRIEVSNSKGEKIITKKYTALEKQDILAMNNLSSNNSLTIDNMISKNMIFNPIYTQIFKEQQGIFIPIEKTLTNYQTLSNGNIVAENIKHSFGLNPFETKVQFNHYDNFGNLLEQQKPNDIKEVYIYGYNNQYPVAKVLGSDYTTVYNTLTTQDKVDLNIAIGGAANDNAIRAILNKLRSLPNTMVTTYTYAPLIGVTSETDPQGKTIYYEYDGFNRLKLIKDKDGNILKTFDYKYLEQQ